MPRWIPENAVRAIHAQLLDEHGGVPGPPDIQKLQSTLARPKNVLAYGGNPAGPSLADLAAAYGFGFAKNHCFPDGNKRLALASIDVFLEMNGRELTAGEVEGAAIIEMVANDELDQEGLALWIAANSAPLAP